jgi:hypothetical protein
MTTQEFLAQFQSKQNPVVTVIRKLHSKMLKILTSNAKPVPKQKLTRQQAGQ